MTKKIVVLFTFFYFITAAYSGPLRSEDSASIQWFEWGPNAFRLARKEDKPILLYLTSSWCHWVRVMDAETFTDPEVIRFVGQLFVPVRVDTDLRPDLNARYNIGGWPSTVFLTPDGVVLAGAAFLSASQMKGTLPEISRLYREKAKEMNEKFRKDQLEFEALLGREIRQAKDEDLAPSFIDKILASLVLASDDEFGGMGKEEKVPVPEVTEFLFLLQEVRPDPKAAKLLESFLEGERKLFDREQGGFFRYATQRDWTQPEYEKMLGVNAFLMRDFLWSLKLFGRAKDKEPVTATLGYVEETLLDKALGGFFGSQGPDLVLVTSGPEQKEEDAVIPGSVYYSYPKQKRLELGTPPVDRHVYAGPSAQMISALIETAQKTNSPASAGELALRALDFLMEVSFDPEMGMKHVFPESDPSAPMLEDQVWVLKALLDAYDFSRDEKYLKEFQQLLPLVEKTLGSAQGIFYDMVAGKEAVGNLSRREIPLTENCLMARIYIRLSAQAGKEIYPVRNKVSNGVYRQKARAILNFFAPRFQSFSFFSAAYGSALIDWFYPGLEVKVIGKKNDARAQSLWEAVEKLPTNRMRAEWQEPAGTDAPKVVMSVGKQSLTPAETSDKIPVLFEVAQKIIQSGA